MYAQWNPLSYTIQFDAHSGSGTMSSITAYAGQSIQLPANAYTKNNAFFVGWNLKNSRKHFYYTNGEDNIWIPHYNNNSNSSYYSVDGYERVVYNDCSAFEFYPDYENTALTFVAQWKYKSQILKGDVNLDNEINIDDVTLLQKYIAGQVFLNDAQLYAADYNNDSAINIDDVTEIQLYILLN